jgi:GWxTD domain-containing protein
MNISTTDTLLCSYLIVLCIGFMGCAKSFNPDIERGSNYQFKEGHPEVRFSAIGLINEEGEPHINVSADIVYGSLIYDQEDDTHTSNITIDIQIIDQENPDNIIESKEYTLNIEKEDPNIVYSQDTFTFQRDIPVDPGDYKINFTLTDLNSDKKITSSTQTFIPNPTNNISNLTNIMLMGKNMDDDAPAWSPINTYDVPGRIDSLKFVFQVTNNDSDEPMTVDSRLLRFKSDTSHAQPMHYNRPSDVRLNYKGIEYSDDEIIQNTQRKLLEEGNVLIEFTFGQQQRGNYRFEVEADSESEDSEMYKARDFSVKSDNYPSIQSPREMARPLAYLMNEKNHKQLMKISNPDSLKRAVDRFWLRNIGNKNKTKDVISKFYNRVEEANKQFSNFKEGWKTDRGMMFILFGRPWYIDRINNDTIQWSYSYNRSEPERNFYFHRPHSQSEYFPFEYYILRRSDSYYRVQYRQVQLWLSGVIMERQI